MSESKCAIFQFEREQIVVCDKDAMLRLWKDSMDKFVGCATTEGVLVESKDCLLVSLRELEHDDTHGVY